MVGPSGPRSSRAVLGAPTRAESPAHAPPPRSVPQAAKLHEHEHKEESLRLQQLEERRRLQEAELRRVEEEKERALGLQRRERELRARLLSLLLSKKADEPRATAAESGPASPADLLRISHL